MPPFQRPARFDRSTLAALLVALTACSSGASDIPTAPGDAASSTRSVGTGLADSGVGHPEKGSEDAGLGRPEADAGGATRSDGGDGTHHDAGHHVTSGTACDAVAGFAVTSTSATSVALSFAGAPGVTVQVTRETYCGADDYVTLATLPAGATSYTDHTVQANWVYWYKIVATDGAGGTASAAIATQAASTPTVGCSTGATSRASGVSPSACSAPSDGGSLATEADSGVQGDSGTSVVPTTASPPPIPSTAAHVTCTNSSGDAMLVQNAINANAAVAVRGTCALGATTLTLPADEFLSGPATFEYTGSGFAMQGSASGDTVAQVTFDGGGIELTSSTTQAGWSVTFNTFENIFSGSDAIHVDNILGVGAPSTISNNTFTNIWAAPGGYPNLPSGQTPASCGQDCFSGGSGFFFTNGLDNTTIDSNVFDKVGYDCIKGFWDAFIGNASPYTGHNVVISNNVMTRNHRIGIEVQGTGNGSCPGGCNFNNIATDGTVFKNNFYSQPALDNNVFAYSLMFAGTNGQIINNTGNNDVATCYVRAGIGLENAPNGGVIQGNVIGSVPQSCSTVGWADPVATGYTNAGYTNHYQNNLFCGPGSAGRTVFTGQDPDNDATMVETADAWIDACPGTPNISSSSLVVAFTSPDDQSLTSGGSATWSVSVTNTISVKNVSFYVDTSTSPVVVQELQDVNANFATNQEWLYHATFDVTSLPSGSHTLKAVATDVSNTTLSASQTFTR